MKPIIHLENITKTYGSGETAYQALKGITLEIQKGDFIAIMGPSGSGKSTLMNIIGALDMPTTGKYLLNGTEIHKYSEDELAEIRNKEIGFVFQSFNLLPKVTAIKNIERPMMYANTNSSGREARAHKSLVSMGLGDKANNLPAEMSGGQAQRVAIARALVMQPSVILADEPTGSLDSKTGSEIMEIFTRLNEDGHTIVLITHEDNIAQFAKRIIRLHDGTIQHDSRRK